MISLLAVCASLPQSARSNATDMFGELEVTPNQLSSLDHWHVSHRITPSSPLWGIRDSLRKNLKSVDVSLSAYDTAFQQEVKLFVHYQREEIVHNAHFEPMESTNEDGSMTLIDCSKLDQIKFPAVGRSTSGRRHERRLSRAPSLSRLPVAKGFFSAWELARQKLNDVRGLDKDDDLREGSIMKRISSRNKGRQDESNSQMRTSKREQSQDSDSDGSFTFNKAFASDDGIASNTPTVLSGNSPTGKNQDISTACV